MIPWKDADFSERDIEPCEKSSEYYMVRSSQKFLSL